MPYSGSPCITDTTYVQTNKCIHYHNNSEQEMIHQIDRVVCYLDLFCKIKLFDTYFSTTVKK